MRELPPGEPPADSKPVAKRPRGWWPDPEDRLLLRYYDRTRWTDRTTPSSLGVPGPRKVHFRYELRQSFRRHVTWDRIWGGTIVVLFSLMSTLYFSDEPRLGWLAMVAICAVLAGPLVSFLLPSS